MKHLHLLFLLYLCSAALSQAAPIDSAQARRLALDFLSGRSLTQSGSASSRHRVVQRFSQASLQSLPAAYMLKEGDEFVLVSRDDAATPILGFRLENESNRIVPHSPMQDTMPPALQAMLRSPLGFTGIYPPVGEGYFHAVSPLLTTTRHQRAPYNNLCPLYRKDNGTYYSDPCLVGCVATAMEQVITFHRPFITLLDTLHGWSTDHITVDDVMPGSTLDTRLILDNYDNTAYTPAQADAVSRLSLWLGLACHMQWGTASSGAYSQDLVNPLRKAFGFPYVHYLEKRKYDPSAFWKFLAQEVMDGRPVYYAGAIMATGGHAFVLDGLDDEGFFHVNWGYGGDFDGYFRLDILSYAQPEADRRAGVEVTDGFLADQEAIVMSTTPVTDTVIPDTLTRSSTDIVLESMEVMQAPQTNNYTTIRLQVRNPSVVQPLENTFALLEDLPTDTSFTSQGQCIAMTAAHLDPLESKTLEVHARFSRTGNLLLSVTHDGQGLLGTQSVDVTSAPAPTFVTEVPTVTITDGQTAKATAHITNASSSDRASQTFLYDLLDNDANTSCRTTHYIYLDAAADTTDTVRFTSLIPGHSYTLRLRERWPIVQSVTFTMPTTSAISTPLVVNKEEETNARTEWFTIDGHRLPSRPHGPGIYILRQNGQTKKIISSISDPTTLLEHGLSNPRETIDILPPATS